MDFVLPLLVLLGGAGLLSLLFHRRFEACAPLAVMLGALVIYAFACFGLMAVGQWAVILGAAAFVPVLILRLLRGKRGEVAQLLLTPGMLIFLLLYAFVYVLNLNRGYTLWDEFSFWGLAAKETVRTGGLHVFPEAGVTLHKDYPPIVTVLQAFWCMLCGGYREAYAYRALQTLILTLFLPALSLAPRNGRGLCYGLIGMVAAVGATLAVRLGSATMYLSIYMDGPMALLSAYELFLALSEERFDGFASLRLGVALGFLALSKQMGVGMALLALVALLINRRSRGQALLPKMQKRNVLPLALIVGLPLLCWGSWRVLTAILGVGAKFDSGKIDLLSLPSIIASAPGYEDQRAILGLVCRALMENVLVARPLELSYLQLTAVCAGLFALLGWYTRDVWSRRRMSALNVWLTLGALLYAGMMALLYLFSFERSEALRLISFSRYMGIYPLCWIALMAMLLLRAQGEKARAGKPLVRPALALAAVFWAVLLPGTTALTELKPALIPWSMTAYCEEDAEILLAHTEEDARVFILAERTSGYPLYNIHYQITPREVNYTHFSLGERQGEADQFTVALTPAEWRAELADYDYLYLYETDDAFAAEYAALFAQPPQAKQLYRVVTGADGAVELELVI